MAGYILLGIIKIILIVNTFAGNDYGGITGTVAGWGQLSEISSTSLSLRHATLPLWSEKECYKVPEFKKTRFTTNMLCAGLKEGGKDSCQVKLQIILGFQSLV